jgi:hypothetical protein
VIGQASGMGIVDTGPMKSVIFLRWKSDKSSLLSIIMHHFFEKSQLMNNGLLTPMFSITI